MRPLFFFAVACTSGPGETGEGATDSGKPDTADTAGDTADTAAVDYSTAIAAVQKAAKRDLRNGYATGVSVAVWKDGEVVYAEGFGTRHPDTEEPVGTTTLFQIGSDTKKITAIAALRQVETGTLSLDDTVADVVPELVFLKDAPLAAELTLDELLSHQSAIFDYTPWTDAPDDTSLYDRTVGRFAENEFRLGPSGLFCNYSNPNFSLAGLLTQAVDGRMWPDIVEDDVFAPLGMTRTFARKTSVEADGDYATGVGYAFPDGHDSFDPLAASSAYTFGTVELADTVDDGFIRPAGLVWSTASDMARLAGFLVDGDPAVLSDALREQLTTSLVPMYPATDAADYGYGYGLMINNFGWSGYEGYYDHVPLWAHGGNTMTMTSGFYILPEQRMAVAVLSNGYGGDFIETAVRAMEGFADLPEPDATGSTFIEDAAPEDAEALAGTWVDPNLLGRLTLTWDGDVLLAEAPDLEAAGVAVGATLDPYYKDLYLLSIDGTDRDFSYYEDGEGGAWLVNRSFAFERSTDNAVAPALRVAPGGHLPPRFPDLRDVARGLPTRAAR